LPEGYNVTKQNKGSDTVDSDANSDGIVDVFKPTKPQNNEYDVGIYCDCEKPVNNKVSASTLNFAGIFMFILFIFGAVKREN